MDETQYYEATTQLPARASTLAAQVDDLYYQVFWISVAFFIGIVGCMVWFAYRYRRRPGHTAVPTGHAFALEVFWTFSPLILLAYLFHAGFSSYMFMSVPPEESITIRVRGQSWLWEYEQPNGMTDSEMVVPVNRPVRLVMSSLPSGSTPAVLHSFYVPEFRIKRDLVPGMFTSMWFEANRVGNYQVYCTEYCGTGHSRMLSNIKVVSPEEYQDYLRDGPSRPDEYDTDAAWGEALFASNGCVACHNRAEGAGRLVGPNLWGVVGTMQPIEGEGDVLANLDYMRESIRYPEAKIVEGYNNQMVSYANMQNSVLNALISYLATLSPDAGTSVMEELSTEREALEEGG